jgi:hypothetical protein
MVVVVVCCKKANSNDLFIKEKVTDVSLKTWPDHVQL